MNNTGAAGESAELIEFMNGVQQTVMLSLSKAFFGNKTKNKQPRKLTRQQSPNNAKKNKLQATEKKVLRKKMFALSSPPQTISLSNKVEPFKNFDNGT
jgi:hypothetical protein